MHHFSPFEVVPANTVEPGSIVLLTRREVVATPALAVRLRSQIQAFVLLQPPTDIYGGQPGVLFANVFGSGPVLKVPNAKALLRSSPKAAVFALRSDDVPLGALSFADDGRLSVTAMSEHTRMVYALDNGDEMNSFPRQVWFPVWDIATPDANGKLQVIRTIGGSAHEP